MVFPLCVLELASEGWGQPGQDPTQSPDLCNGLCVSIPSRGGRKGKGPSWRRSEGGGQGFCLWRLRHTFRASLQLLWEQPVIKIKITPNQENRPSQPSLAPELQNTSTFLELTLSTHFSERSKPLP